MKRNCKRIIAMFLCVLIFAGFIPDVTTVYATQNKSSNYSTAFTLTGNGADDIVSVAKAQVGKTGSQLGYSEQWCADFVGDCAALANQGSAIPRNGYCPSLQTAILNAGGYAVSVSSARKGDIAFYGTNGSSHVEIIYANNNGRISSIGGNSGSGSSCYTRSVRDHSSQSMTITKVLRPNYGSRSKILPGTVESGWNVPTTVTASKKITTYDEYGNAESNHYIDPGDSCYISEVYTNGFVKVQYPVSGGKRWAYAKASDFSISKSTASQLPATRLHAWFSFSAMGDEATSIRYNDLVYLCYRVETTDGKLLNSSVANYSIKETLYFPDGSTVPCTYDNSNNNWIRSNFNQWGSYRGKVEISGDYTGSVEVTFNLNMPSKLLLKRWFSSSKMGGEVSYLEKGKTYYYCYDLTCTDSDGNGSGYFNKYLNVDYTVTENIYGPDGKKVSGSTYNKSDNNCISFVATQTGSYKGELILTGFFDNRTDSRTITCKDTTVKLKSIKVTKYPTKTSYTVGDTLDKSGMVVTATYSNGTTKNVTGYQISGSTSKAGNATVTVSYTEGGVTCKDSFTVTVAKATATITYDANGGTMANKTQTGTKGTYVLLKTAKPTKNVMVSFNTNGSGETINYFIYSMKFKGWLYDTGSGTTLYTSGSKFLLKNDCTLTASYDDAEINRLPSVKREGYTFDGWYAPSGEKVDIGTTLSGNTTLTAHWTKLADEESKEDSANSSNGDDEISEDESDEESSEDDLDPLEVGDEIATDDVIYTITQLGDTPCVEYTELFDEDEVKVTIPSTIEQDGVTYWVTSIGEKAFYKNTEIQKVTIGENITKIGKKAFYGCSSLKRITVKTQKLTSDSIETSAFTKIYKQVKIYVPAAKYKTYKKLLKKAGAGSKAKFYKL